MGRVLPMWRQALLPGGALTLSFNTHTLRRVDLAHSLTEAGFEVLDEYPFDECEHFVEQAVMRDYITARRP